MFRKRLKVPSGIPDLGGCTKYFKSETVSNGDKRKASNCYCRYKGNIDKYAVDEYVLDLIHHDIVNSVLNDIIWDNSKSQTHALTFLKAMKRQHLRDMCRERRISIHKLEQEIKIASNRLGILKKMRVKL